MGFPAMVPFEPLRHPHVPMKDAALASDNVLNGDGHGRRFEHDKRHCDTRVIPQEPHRAAMST